MEERTFSMTEQEINKIFQFVITKPINEAIEVYNILLEIGKKANADLDNLAPSDAEVVDEGDKKSK